MITIYDVAKAAEVSPKTAARILSGDYGGRPKNRERVLSAAKRLGYVRNQQAANLRSGRSRLIGVVVPDIRNPYYPIFYQHIHDAAIARGYHILLSSTSGRALEEQEALRIFEMNRVDAIILNSAEGESDEECDVILSRLIKGGVAAIVAGRPVRNLAASESAINNIASVGKAVAYLHRTGHRRMAFLSGPLETLAAKERQTGFLKGIEACGLPRTSVRLSEGQFTIESGIQQTQLLLGSGERPTAIVAANDLLAIGAMQCIQAAGLIVPKDVAIIGFDDNPLAELVTPKLTTLRTPIARIAADCVSTVLDQIAQRDKPPALRRLEYEADLIVRDSA